MSLSARYCSRRVEQLTIDPMLNRAAVTAIWLLFVVHLFGQSPAPSAGSKASPSPSPSATPSTEQLINSLGDADLQAAVSLLKSNFTNPEAITDTELSRATLQGLLVRMPGGLLLVPGKESATAETPAALYSEVFETHIGYFRFGALDSTNLKELD